MKSFRASPRLSPFRPPTLCQRFYTTKTLTGRNSVRHGGSTQCVNLARGLRALLSSECRTSERLLFEFQITAFFRTIKSVVRSKGDVMPAANLFAAMRSIPLRNLTKVAITASWHMA